jgi:hypothetical protein
MALVESIRASLELLEVAADQVTFPIYCGPCRAVLGSCDSGLHLVGHTGAGKTELAALAQQHFGAGLDARHLPGSWLSTDNALESLAFVAKDALLVVDDFCPTGSQYDLQAMHRKADRLFRGQGNTAGRGRLRADGTLRPTRPPRGMLLSTGEDVPRGQSLRARVMVVEVPQTGIGAVDWPKLTDCQAKAAAGRYAQAMAGFLRWLAPSYRDLQRDLRTEASTLKEQAYHGGQHRRTPDIVANLAVGFQYFLTFAQEVGAVDQNQAAALWQRCWEALGEVAAAQQEHQSASDPVRRFLELLAATVSSGRAYLSDSNGDAPEQATAWGWREVEVGAGDNVRTEWRPQGEHIGWVDGGEFYLQGDAAFAVVQKLARDGGDQLPLTLATLKKRLRERGLLASTEKHASGRRAVERCEVRRTLQSKRRWVLHFSAAYLANTPAESEPCEPSEPSQEESYLARANNGSQDGSQTGDDAGKVSHGSEPPRAVAVSKAVSNGSLGSHGSQIAAIDLLREAENTTHPSRLWEEEL